MASLLPLLHDLLPMIMPSEVRVTRNHELLPVAERAERPPWYQRARQVEKPQKPAPLQATELGADVDEHNSLISESDSGNADPIQLFDHERGAEAGPVLRDALRDMDGPRDKSRGAPASPQQFMNGPEVFRKDAMVGVTDTMCATGESRSTRSGISLKDSPACLSLLLPISSADGVHLTPRSSNVNAEPY